MDNENFLERENKEIISLNNNLYDEFYIEELESRLETDPLAMGGIVELFTQGGSDITAADWCVGKSDCQENTGNSCGLQVCNCVVDLCSCILECNCILQLW